MSTATASTTSSSAQLVPTRTAIIRGQSYVVFGGPGVGSGGVLELSALDGSNGFALNGINAYDYSGWLRQRRRRCQRRRRR